MSVFGTNQVENLLIGDAVASETTVDGFISSASVGELKVLSADGTAPAADEAFKVYQKTAGDAAKNLNFEFSDLIKPNKVKKVVLAPFSAEVQKSVRIEGFDGNVLANHTYAVEVRIYEEGGSLSVENFSVVTGYYTTGANVTNVTAANIRDGIVESLNYNLQRRGNSELVITTPDANETDILLTGKVQTVVPGKIEGRQIKFDVFGKVFDNTSITGENLDLLTKTLVQAPDPGVGTGKYVTNLEWFVKGFNYEPYRGMAYPVDFNTPYYANQNSNYNIIHVIYFDDRESPTVEQQRKVLTIAVDYTDLASNAATNGVLGDLRTILANTSVDVPADLATS